MESTGMKQQIRSSTYLKDFFNIADEMYEDSTVVWLKNLLLWHIKNRIVGIFFLTHLFYKYLSIKSMNNKVIIWNKIEKYLILIIIRNSHLLLIYIIKGSSAVFF